MSSIGSVQGNSLMPQLQRIGVNQGTERVSARTRLDTAAETTGMEQDQLEELRAKVQAAVQAAVEDNADASDAELMEAVQTAVDAVLEENGVDPEEFRSQLAQYGPQGGGGGQTPPGMQGARSMQGRPPGPPPGGPPPTGATGAESASSGTTSSSETDEAIQTLLDSDMSFEAIIEELMAAAEERAQVAQDTETQATEDTAVTSDSEGAATAAASTDDAIQRLLDSGLSFEDIVRQLVVARDEEDSALRASRLAHMVTSALFGPAVDAYA